MEIDVALKYGYQDLGKPDRYVAIVNNKRQGLVKGEELLYAGDNVLECTTRFLRPDMTPIELSWNGKAYLVAALANI